MTEIQGRLFALQNTGYRDFLAKLVPTVDKEAMIGIAVPQIKSLAGELHREQPLLVRSFLQELPHQFFEENNLHIFLIDRIQDFHECRAEVERFLPHLDNWATCDSLRPKSFRKHPHLVLPLAKDWMTSPRTYTIRFGIGCMHSYFLDDYFQAEHLELVGRIQSDDYYVRMMQAWYYATALAKHHHAARSYLAENRLGSWVHNKALQKALESRRIPAELKTALRGMKR